MIFVERKPFLRLEKDSAAVHSCIEDIEQIAEAVVFCSNASECR